MTATAEQRTDTRDPDVHSGLSGRWRRVLLLFATFVCAACGLVYELALVAQGSYLLGDSVTQASVVLATMVFAMGIGSLAAKPLQRNVIVGFAVVELALAAVGGLSVITLYAAFAWLDAYWPGLIGTALLVGLLIGAEIPLLMTMLQRIRRQEAGSATADLFAADYVGALIGGLAFPFLLLPLLGQAKGALVVGGVNAVAGVAVALGLFGGSLVKRQRVGVGAGSVAVLLVLGLTFVGTDSFLTYSRSQLYDDPVVLSETSRYQEITLTQSSPVDSGPKDTRLFLNGDLQFSSVDEYRYHESLVHPVMAGKHDRVLVLGGGDGLAMREVLKYPDVRKAVEVELDPDVLRLARTDSRLTSLNRDSLRSPRVRVDVADAFNWLRETRERFDAIIVDMPDPDSTATAKLYSTEFYALAKRALADDGRMVVQSGSPYFAPRTFSCITSTVASAGLATVPYHVDVPSFGDWGFTLAAKGKNPPALDLNAPERLRFLDEPTLQAARSFPMDSRPQRAQPSTLDDPRVVRLEGEEWQTY